MFGLGSCRGLMGAAGALLARYILARVSPVVRTVLLLAFAGQALLEFLTLNREPERPPDRPRARLGSYPGVAGGAA